MKAPRTMTPANGHMVVEVSCQCGTVWVNAGYLDDYPQRCFRCRTTFHRGAQRTLGKKGVL